MENLRIDELKEMAYKLLYSEKLYKVIAILSEKMDGEEFDGFLDKLENKYEI